MRSQLAHAVSVRLPCVEQCLICRSTRDVSRQAALSHSDVIRKHVPIWIIAAILRLESDGRLLKQAQHSRTPGLLCGSHGFLSEVPGSIDCKRGQHLHTSEKQRAVGYRKQ